MHRATPATTSFRSYVSGGARSVIDKVDDSKLMQEMAGNFMKGETRKGVEAPQNYGFTSVVMDADKDAKTGKVKGSAEGFISFCGGNRSFPVCSIMDDRRHRLKGLAKGDVAMFRTAQDQLQFHLAQAGGFWTGPSNKKLRMALVAPKETRAGEEQQKGQSPQHETDSTQYLEVNGTVTENVNKQHKIVLQNKTTGMEVNPDSNTYLGAIKGGGTHLRVMLEDGTPSPKVWALKGGGLAAVEASSSDWYDKTAIAEARAKVSAALEPLGITLADLALALGL